MRAFVLLLCASAAAFAAKPGLNSETIWDIRQVTDPQITKDAKSVIYVMGWSDKMVDQRYSNLWIVSGDGKDNRPLTSGAFRDTSPRLSPDGTRVAYLSNRSGKNQIHVRWLDSAQDAQITDLQQAPSSIEWSPDGKWIGYIARVPAKADWSIRMPDKPNGARWADPPIVVTKLRWRQDGQGLVQPGYSHVFAVPSTGGAPKQITSGDFNHGGQGGFGGGFAWSADGKSIYVSTNRATDWEYDLKGGDIYAYGLDDGSVKQLTKREGPDTNPEPSPGGKKIAYIGHDWKFQSYTVNHLYVMDADGSNQKNLTPALDRDVRNPQWSWDGTKIFFLVDERGSTQLYSCTLDSGEVKPITSGIQQLGAGGAAGGGFTIANNLMVATVRSTPENPGDVVVLPAYRQSPAPVRLTSANDSLMSQFQLGAVEELTYDSFDGKSMQGWIIKPPNFDSSKKYPFILEIHGGPHAMYGVGFQHEMQIQAARGFVVLYTNPRGSTGYGEEFGNIIHTKYPGDDFTDLMKGVDKMIEKGYIDPKKLCVTGGSGGGLLTAWTIGHTDRFAAAVSQYPVTNWITQAGTADGGYTHSALWLKAFPWENPKQFLDRSPIFFAKNFKTPTMVITGEADLRTPIAESEELYFALKAMKVPAVMIRVPEESHGIRQRNSHYIAKVEHILAWMEKYTR
ncbi:MAG TPA: S9 family peptidase [Bryobacteraceae bacterium]|nr:S9 family peptidase [Bryobacteraceae bacterium]